ncbi:hypothetical protein GCM10007868_19690 [Gluconobacter frateurii]|uniref:Uncharacterized protein n=1 Tax=Gluconobacter frateurii NRIC 0228 TaxID=1307946 RepID=A0ABQ0Q8M6_9PROT|nr:hypothetical protein AA0228_0535 [Gluconobacter frateurii NRIC 0228]GLP90894.1 hypothetical protein GCM10007868_19690 [Gluconobacter frateurii]
MERGQKICCLPCCEKHYIGYAKALILPENAEEKRLSLMSAQCIFRVGKKQGAMRNVSDHTLGI